MACTLGRTLRLVTGLSQRASLSVDLAAAIRIYTLAKTTLEATPGAMGGNALAALYDRIRAEAAIVVQNDPALATEFERVAPPQIATNG